MHRRVLVTMMLGVACKHLRAQAQAQAQMQAPGQDQKPARIRISTLLEDDPATTIAGLILREAYTRLGLSIELLNMPGERSLISANTGFTDGELYRKAGLEASYINLLMVPVPLMTYEIVAFSKTLDIPLNGWESLRPYRFDFVKGIKIIEVNTAGMKLETVATMRQAFSKLERQRTEMVLANRVSGLAQIKAMKLGQVRVLSPPLASFPVYHYLHKRHAELIPRLTKVMQDMQHEKFMQGVQEQVLSKLTPAPP